MSQRGQKSQTKGRELNKGKAETKTENSEEAEDAEEADKVNKKGNRLRKHGGSGRL